VIKQNARTFDTTRVKRFLPILVLAAVAAVVKVLPWWGSVAVLVGLGLAAKLFAGRFLMRILLGAFKAKSAALSGADATLHGITAAQPPKSDADGDAADVRAEELELHGPVRWVHIDLTVHVPDDNGGKTPFRLWDPHELQIVPVDAKPGTDVPTDETVGTIAAVEVYDGGSWVTAEGKLEGSQRIRLHAGVQRDVQYFKLRYYFEILENRATRRG
jgi:hypothetical protein